MTCAGDNTIAALLAGAIDGEAARRLERHLDGCAACRGLVVELGRGLSAVGDGTRAPAAGRLPQPGERIGRYQVRRVIGVGGMGVVYEAHDTALDRRVAVKLLRPDVRGADGGLLAEAKAMARLSHPNIAAVHDVGVVRGQLYVCMEYVAGATLREWLRERPRTWRQIVEVFAAAGRGLAYVHRAGLVHLDFKPDNVLLGRGGRAVVTDFGLARIVGRSAAGAPGVVAGTPAYMAPEQRRGERCDARADQYAFSAALREALDERSESGEGGRPRSIDELRESRGLSIDARREERGGGGKPPRGIDRAGPPPAWLRRVVARGLAEAAVDRFASMEALLAALQAGARRAQRRLIAAAVATALIGAVVVASPSVQIHTRVVERQIDRVVERAWQGSAAALAAVEPLEACALPAPGLGDAPVAGSALTPPGLSAASADGVPAALSLVAASVPSLAGPDGASSRAAERPRGSPAVTGCSDGSALVCAGEPPACPAPAVVAIHEGCWTCADPMSCAPLGLARLCDDGAPLRCALARPVCPGFTLASIRGGCWTCADPFTCVTRTVLGAVQPARPFVPQAPPRCGDGRCEPGEDRVTCPGDCCPPGERGCASSCGDGVCESDESHASCPGDCCELTAEARCAGSCGDGRCDADERHASCPLDCCELGPTGVCVATCGDRRCEAGEPTTCRVDCACNGGACAARCGDAICEVGEDERSCVADCANACAAGGCGSCGDGVCALGETEAVCPDDCGDGCIGPACRPICGDGVCAPGEDAQQCLRDCAPPCLDSTCMPICGNGSCDRSENAAVCPRDCASPCADGACAACGNGVCEVGEDAAACPRDC